MFSPLLRGRTDMNVLKTNTMCVIVASVQCEHSIPILNVTSKSNFSISSLIFGFSDAILASD